ncbi:MAG: tRNA (guanosine(46)-N7)-methyltransferase TrmB [Gammaproteobacteria bacterium]
MESRPLRKVRSFVRRPGRITVAQRRALETLLPRYGLPYEQRRLDLDAVFGRSAPRVLDIGFGDGEALVTTAARYPEIDYLGVEIHEPGVGHLLLLLERAGLENVRVIVHDVVEVIEAMLPDASFDAINLFFPDPWPKKRHHKRRLVQPPFIAQCERIMKPGALLHVATDWAPYAEHTREVLAQSALQPVAAQTLAGDPLAERPPTKFERRGERLGHVAADLYYRRPPASEPA